jgi:hypothetical protein
LVQSLFLSHSLQEGLTIAILIELIVAAAVATVTSLLPNRSLNRVNKISALMFLFYFIEALCEAVCALLG